MANAVLKKTGDEGKAVRIANAAVKRKKRGKTMTNCPQCKAMGLDHDEIEARCRGSLYWFCYYMVSDWVSQSLHLPIAWRLQEWTKGHNTGSYLLMIPRGHLKTTMVSIAYPLWRLINDPSLRVLLAMSSQRLVREKVGKMQSVVLSKTFRHWFGHLVPDIADVRGNSRSWS